MINKSLVASYLLSLFTVTTTLVYGIDLPTLLTGQKELVSEYYYKNFDESLMLDTVIVGAYIGVGYGIISTFGSKDMFVKLLLVASTSGLISSLFLILFSYGWQKDTFFSRWFEAVGFRAVVYDVIIVTSVYCGVEWLNKLIARRLVHYI